MKFTLSILACALAIVASAEVRIVEVGDFFFRDVVSDDSQSVILQGDTIRWVWVAGSHTTTSSDGLWDAPMNRNNQTFEYTFANAGEFEYFCRPHSAFQRGNVVVLPATPLGVNAFQVTRGQLQGGDLPELQSSDDQYLVVQQRAVASPATPNVQVVFESAPAPANVQVIRLRVEASCSGAPSSNVVFRTEAFDFQAGSWVRIDERNPTTTDTRYEFALPGNATEVQRFIDGSTRAVRTRLSYFDRGATSPAWRTRFDQVQVVVGTGQ